MAARSRRDRHGTTPRLPRKCGESGSAVPVPAALLELAEDDEVAAVDGDHLPVAPAERPVGPPAVLDEPRLAHRDDLVAVDGQRPAARAGQDVRGPRDGEAAGAGAHRRCAGTAVTARTA